MKKALSVARWEYMEKVTTRAFLLGLFLTPIIMVATGVLPTLFVNQEDNETKVIGIIDQSGVTAGPFADRMEHRYRLASGQPNYLVRNIAVGRDLDIEKAVAEANRLVTSDQIIGYCVINNAGRLDSIVEYRSKAVGDFRIGTRIEENLHDILAEQRAVALGLDTRLLRDLNVRMDVKMVKLSKSGEREEAGFERVFLSAYVFVMMLFLLIMTSGQLLVRSVIEEKSNRIVEVLVSSCSPTQLMAGKVLGLSALGFTQIGFWALIGVAASLQFGITLVDPGQAALLTLYFILGYLLYAAIFVAAGSSVTTEQEAQQITSYLVILLVIPIAIAFPAMKNPDAGWLKVLTYIPLLTPAIMTLRIPIQMPAASEVIITVFILVGSIYASMVAAGRIFRVGILSMGKSPRMGEIFRWIRKG
jgi:ABC-2 type transport system permease protein